MGTPNWNLKLGGVLFDISWGGYEIFTWCFQTTKTTNKKLVCENKHHLQFIYKYISATKLPLSHISNEQPTPTTWTLVFYRQVISLMCIRILPWSAVCGCLSRLITWPLSVQKNNMSTKHPSYPCLGCQYVLLFHNIHNQISEIYKTS